MRAIRYLNLAVILAATIVPTTVRAEYYVNGSTGKDIITFGCRQVGAVKKIQACKWQTATNTVTWYTIDASNCDLDQSVAIQGVGGNDSITISQWPQEPNDHLYECGLGNFFVFFEVEDYDGWQVKLWGGDGLDFLHGGDNESVVGGPGHILYGGNDADDIQINGSTTTGYGGAGDDRIRSFGNATTGEKLYGEDGEDCLEEAGASPASACAAVFSCGGSPVGTDDAYRRSAVCADPADCEDDIYPSGCPAPF